MLKTPDLEADQMDDMFIISSFVVIDDVMKVAGHQSHALAQVSDAEAVTVAIVAAKYFQNHFERALCVMQLSGYLQNKLSASRYNRRIHQLASWLASITQVLAELFSEGHVFIIDSCPLPVCKRVRAGRCKKVRGKAFCGYCSAKQEKFFGWRLHLVCTAEGVPVSFALIEGAHHDLTAIHELCFVLPEGAKVYGDKAFNSADDEATMLQDTGVELIPIRRKNMTTQNTLAETFALQRYRHQIETLNSQLEHMGLQRLKARTNSGFFIKLHASLLALVFSNCTSN
jgi:hypothetical protein